MKFHHLEMCAKNGPKMVQFFTQKLDFQLTASRRTETGDQWVVSNRSAPIIVTENYAPTSCSSTAVSHETRKTIKDSVFDVALQVDDVHRMTEEMQGAGIKVLVEPTRTTDENGSVVRSTVHTGFGNITHTLIEKKSYKGSFLPGWNSASKDRLSSKSSALTGNVDHVTYACMPGEMDDILHWYKRWFGMDRIFMDESDDVRHGLVIGGTIGIRLKAAKAPSTSNDQPHRPLFLVLAEPLTVHEGNHVNVFLEKHGGPGVEHIALTTQDIVHTVSELRNRGLQFRAAPEYGTLTNEVETNADKHLRSLDILLDREEGDRYLYQAFTLPIFDEPTLFLELIQRKGAQAFGAGNITRIMKSIEKKF